MRSCTLKNKRWQYFKSDRTTTASTALSAALTAALAGAACSSDGNSASFSSGVPSDREVSSLTADEYQDLCRAAEQSFNGLLNGISVAQFCTFGSVIGSPDAATCEAAVSQCTTQATEADVDAAIDDEDFECGNEDIAGLASCSFTVGELETCMNAVLSSFESAVQSLSCDMAGDAGALEAALAVIDDNPFASTAECQGLLESSCSIAIIDESDSDL